MDLRFIFPRRLSPPGSHSTIVAASSTRCLWMLLPHGRSTMMMRLRVPTLRVGAVTSSTLARQSRNAFLTQVISDVCDSAKGMRYLTIKLPSRLTRLCCSLRASEPGLLQSNLIAKRII